jgi:hypothetical protein
LSPRTLIEFWIPNPGTPCPMLILFGFLVVAAVLSLPDVDSVGRTQNQNTGKKDGEKMPD